MKDYSYYFVSAHLSANSFTKQEGLPKFTNLLIQSIIPLTLRELEKEVERSMSSFIDVDATILSIQFLTEQQYLELK